MNQVVLQIRLTGEPQRQAAAWFIAGDDPHVWLAELVRWQIALDEVRLYVLPDARSKPSLSAATDAEREQVAREGRKACGVLVLPPAGFVPHQTRRAEGYGRHSPRLYLPIRARLDPPASEREVDAELLNPLAVWHPTAGLIGFDDADALRVADLFEAPSEFECDWGRAQPGMAVPPRLVAVLQPEPPALEQSLADWRDDIGSAASEELPPAPDEPGDSLPARAAQQARRALAKLAVKLAALAPRTAKAPTWINHVEDWARRQLSAARGALDAARHKEINRLLHMLDTNPDQGLRHALPLGGGGYRGEATPGARLGNRDVNFQLDRLQGAGPADPWNIDQAQQLALRRRYRELANREAQLGRHRRAAYIFAHLLDDLAATADVLQQGGHDREAAVLYRDRLGRPLDAARCLERCGAWEEAIEIYADQKEFEKAAELLTRLERADEAAAMYRRAVEHWNHSGNPCRAAKLLEEKLAAIDEAIEMLTAAWPSSSKSADCLRELFALFGRYGRHDEAQRWVVRLRDEVHSPLAARQAVSTLASVAQRYPDIACRHSAADVTRVLAGNRLPTATHDDAAVMVQAVRSLVPQDELLGRDAARWLARRQQPRPAMKYGPPQPELSVVEKGRFKLNGNAWYKSVVAREGGFIAAGFTPRGVTAVDVNDALITPYFWKIPLLRHPPLMLAKSTTSDGAVIALAGGPPLEPSDDFGTPSWLTPDTIAVACSSLGVWWSVDQALLLTAMREGGAQFSSRQFSLAELGVRAEPRDELPDSLAVMLARRDDVYLGLGHTLVKVKSDRVEQIQLKGWVRQLVASPLVLHLRLAVGFEDFGAAVIWDDLNGCDVLEVAISLRRPELAFTLDGLLVAADDNEGRIYSTSNRGVALRGRFAGPRCALAGLVCGERPGEFTLVTVLGEVIEYRVE